MSNLVAIHAAHLERFRASMNLIGPGPVQSHFDDCERALSWMEPVGRWADLGTGAGFPGIPLAHRFPDVTWELVDSRLKRCIFLEGVLAEAKRKDVEVRCMRVEKLDAGVYDGLVCRAFAKPEAVGKHARRLLKPGGILVSMLNEGQVFELDGFECFHIERYKIDGKARRGVGLRRLAADAG